MKKAFPILFLCAACATQNPNQRVASGLVLGGMTGIAGGVALSPNKESRGANALVFGLTGAVSGALIALLTGSTEPKTSTNGLKDREQISSGRLFQKDLSTDLPPFVRDRISKMVIEEIELPDRIGEDGTLHEPHRAYRIKHGPELVTGPSKSERNKEKKAESNE